MLEDPKSAKKDSQVKQLFANLGSALVKAASKIDPKRDPFNVGTFFSIVIPEYAGEYDFPCIL